MFSKYFKYLFLLFANLTRNPYFTLLFRDRGQSQVIRIRFLNSKFGPTIAPHVGNRCYSVPARSIFRSDKKKGAFDSEYSLLCRYRDKCPS